MKTYEEMAQSALTRGNTLRKKRNRAKAAIFAAVSVLTVCCIVVLAVLGNGGKELTSKTPQAPLHCGIINYLSINAKTSPYASGQPYQYINGTAAPGDGGVAGAFIPPYFEVDSVHVVARAVERYPDVYERLIAYGGTQIYQYRLFRMEVIDPLQSEMEGSFYYMLPNHMEGDLTQYDALLIAMRQEPKNTVLRSGDRLTAFDYLFVDPHEYPAYGSIIPFTDGIFDETLWQGEGWSYVYSSYQDNKDKSVDKIISELLVYDGCTLEETLQFRQAKIDNQIPYARLEKVSHYQFETEAVREALAYVAPFENGVFDINGNENNFQARRYINACPTNERVLFCAEDGTVTYSEYRFEDEDFEKLADIPAYIASLDLSQFTPQHTDTEGKVLIYNSAMGWYEKTENGVYSIVKIAWRYFNQDDRHTQYYDETFILLDETGDYLISAEDLIELIGDNSNISPQYYGKGLTLPT